MKILIIGSGFTGCSFARLLKEKGHKVLIKEKLSYIGGLSYSTISPNGIIYEPCGARTFHTKEKRVKNFVKRFAKFNSYIHRKGIVIHRKLWHYPISLKMTKKMPEAKQIIKELKKRPKNLDKSNFETCMISMLGPTLYKLFVYNYTKKMWGKEPKKLTTEWAPKRIELREEDSELFKGEWQGLPIGGYTKFFKNMIQGIPIQYNCSAFDKSKFDIILFSGRIDELLHFKYGQLPYRSLRFTYKKDENWENNNYGTINLPEHQKYIRKANFKILHQQKSKHNWIQYQEPTRVDRETLPMYPVNTEENNKLFDKYLKEVCKRDKLIPVGRLGLYKYLNMDKAIALAMDMVPLVEEWEKMDILERYNNIRSIIQKY